MWIAAFIFSPRSFGRGGSRTARKAYFSPEGKKAAPIIGATCAFGAKIYKIVDSFFGITSCRAKSKKIFKIFDFCFQLPSLLVDFLDKILANLTVKAYI